MRTIPMLVLATVFGAATWVGLSAAGPASAPADPQTPDEALQALEAGNDRFVRGEMESRDLMAEVKATANGQSPYAMVVACIDSRVSPELVFDQGIGDIFVTRVAGNFVDTDMIGSLEYGAYFVKSKLIVVLGHTSCGAIKGACDDARLGNLTYTLSNLMPAVRATDTSGERSSNNKAFVHEVAETNVELTVDALTDRSVVLNELVEAGKLKIVGAMYDVSTGRVTFMDMD